jgi:MinD superfamily P-loop ATPase containing an inserted ferredoxin domain
MTMRKGEIVMAMRQIIEINEDLCNGCGQCLLDCAEGALQIVDGKAKVVSDILCDGLGACLSGCPQDALKLVTREAPEFDEEAVHARIVSGASACSGAKAAIFTPPTDGNGSVGHGAIKHWPVKLRLTPADAPFLKKANVTLAADCAAPASSGFHSLAEDRLVVIACPKFEDKEDILRKLEDMFRKSDLCSVEVLHMEVPCCGPLAALCREAATRAGYSGELRVRVLGRDGMEKQAEACANFNVLQKPA